MNYSPPSNRLQIGDDVFQPGDARPRAAAKAGKGKHQGADDVTVPDYLENVYWWAYVRPWAIRIFDRGWMINLILWGWYPRLRDAALAMLGPKLPGRTIEIASVYGSFVPKLHEVVHASGGALDVVDVVQAQLNNLRKKLPANNCARLLHMDASSLSLPDDSYDHAVIFFLMHEQPVDVRRRTLDEACRVLKSGGDLTIVEFAKPRWWHPLRYLYLPFLKYFEPFAPDVWGHDDPSFWLSKKLADRIFARKFLFGSYYQILRIRP